jgi:hypothetical protein
VKPVRNSSRVIAVDTWPATPERSCSKERKPFCRASMKVRPIAMTSPTDFIFVPSLRSAPGNFSKAQRGIFTTT